MQVNRAVDYAIRGLLYIASKPQDVRTTLAEMAAARKVPLPYFTNVMKKLAVAGLVRVHRGRGGGYSLMLPPAKINLRSIMEAIEGQMNLNMCLADPDICEFSSSCTVRPVWKGIQEKWLKDLAKYSLPKLLANPKGKIKYMRDTP